MFRFYVFICTLTSSRCRRLVFDWSKYKFGQIFLSAAKDLQKNPWPRDVKIPNKLVTSHIFNFRQFEMASQKGFLRISELIPHRHYIGDDWRLRIEKLRVICLNNEHFSRLVAASNHVTTTCSTTEKSQLSGRLNHLATFASKQSYESVQTKSRKVQSKSRAAKKICICSYVWIGDRRNIISCNNAHIFHW